MGGTGILLLAALLVAPGVQAEGTRRSLSEMSLTSWPDGLPQNTVPVLLQDRLGYLWIGTYGGLVRFNGITFAVHDRSQYPDLPSNSILSLHEDSSGAIWIGTRGGVAILKDGRVASFSLNSSLPDRQVLALAGDGSSGVWIGTRGGLCRAEGSRLDCFTQEAGLPASPVHGLSRDRSGRLWIAYAGAIFSHARGAFRLESESIPGHSFSSIAVAEDGTVFSATRDAGIARLSRGVWTFLKPPGDSSVPPFQALAIDRSGRLWAGTEGDGICLFSDPAQRAPAGECRGTATGLPSAVVRSILEDQEGTVWIGTTAGITALRSPPFVAYTRANGLVSQSVRSVLQSRDGRIWAGTEGGGVAVKEGAFFRPVEALTGAVRSLAEDAAGNIWAGSFARGVTRFDPKKKTTVTYTTASGLSSDSVTSMVAARNGTLWVGGSTGLDRLEGNRFVSVPLVSTPAGRPEPLAVFTLHEDRAGTIWAGTARGLYRVEADRSTNFRQPLPVADVYAILDLGGGALLTGGESGLHVFESGRFTPVRTREGPLVQPVLHLLEDDKGDIWLSTSQGILRIRRKELEAFVKDDDPVSSPEGFTISDGLPSLNCSGASFPAALRAQDGRLWFATNRGLAAVAPGQPSERRPPAIRISGITVDGLQQEARPAGVIIEPDGRNLEILYDALSFVAPPELQFRYRLDGLESAWTEAGSRRSAFYTSLPPGTYTFLVTARRLGGAWGRSSAEMRLVVRPRFTQTRLFFGLVSFGIIAAAFALYRVRVNQLKRRAVELENTVERRTEELREARDEAEERLRLFSELLDTAPDCILLSDMNGRIVVANHQTESIFGYEPAELIGQRIEILVPGELRARHAEHRERFRKAPGVRPMGAGLELHGQRKDGSHFPVEISLSPMETQDGVLVTSIIRDVTDRRRAEERLRLQAVALDSAANGIVITDRSGTIRWVNPAFTTLTGYSSQEVVGKNPRILRSGIHDDAFYQNMWLTVLSGKTWFGETTNRRKDGTLYTEEQTIAPVRNELGEISHFVAIKQDVTSRKESERLRESMARTMVHDLRNPLSVIHGSLGILRTEMENPDPEERTWTLETLERASRQMLDLVNGILDVERLKQGDLPLEKSLFDLTEVLETVLLLQAPLAAAKEQSLLGESEKNLPPVEADRTLIERVLQNLVGNAIKFTPEKGTIRVTVAGGPEGVTVAVADSGAGIPEEVRRRLFSPFITGRQKESGSGLGLAFCRLAVEAHKGRISAETTADRGTVFTFTLPAAEPARSSNEGGGLAPEPARHG